MSSPLFPLFRAKFIKQEAWHSDRQSAGKLATDKELRIIMSGCQSPSGFCRPLALPQLDLNNVQREEGPPSESIIKRQKFAMFEKHCSKVSEGLYVSGEYVAKSREILAEHGITHIVNCVGAMYPEYFKSDGIKYKTLWLQGTHMHFPCHNMLARSQVTCTFYSSHVCYSCMLCKHASRSMSSCLPQPGARQAAACLDEGLHTHSTLRPRYFVCAQTAHQRTYFASCMMHLSSSMQLAVAVAAPAALNHQKSSYHRH